MADPTINTGAYGSRAADAVASGTAKAREQMSEAADRAEDRLEGARRPFADKLHGAADTIRERASHLPGGESIAGAAHSTADKLETSASYIESHDTRQMMQDFMAVVKRNPTQSLLIAAALGFLLARAFRSDSD